MSSRKPTQRQASRTETAPQIARSAYGADLVALCKDLAVIAAQHEGGVQLNTPVPGDGHRNTRVLYTERDEVKRNAKVLGHVPRVHIFSCLRRKVPTLTDGITLEFEEIGEGTHEHSGASYLSLLPKEGDEARGFIVGERVGKWKALTSLVQEDHIRRRIKEPKLWWKRDIVPSLELVFAPSSVSPSVIEEMRAVIVERTSHSPIMVDLVGAIPPKR